MKFRTQLI